MLLLAGVTRSAGGVDTGDTVMDHMEQERERGITIQAAATAFSWRQHDINLIDTPGHVDFTIEVERSTRVLDGAALLVDAVAGAQAQTETVWRQARAHGVPTVAYINKMDREGADFDAALLSLEQRLGAVTLPIQLPLLRGGSDEGEVHRLVDLVGMQLLQYTPAQQSSGGRTPRGAPLRLERISLEAHGAAAPAAAPAADGLPSTLPPALADLAERARAARLTLIERVAELEPDGPLAELYLDEQPVPAEALHAALRRLTLSRAALPAMCGASLRGIGVEPLLDAIGAYLPSPADRESPMLRAPGTTPAEEEASAEAGAGAGAEAGAEAGVGLGANAEAAAAEAVPLAEAAEAVALAFKVVHDQRSKKPVVWLRVYSGTIGVGDTVHNPRTGEQERVLRLHAMNGEDTRDLAQASEGSICAAVGMRRTQTGDTLLLRPSADSMDLRLPELRVPTPVFFSAFETASTAQQPALDAALSALCLEDPSISVRTDPVTAQQLVGGMGELHLQIVADRLRREHRLELYTGAMQVAYREGVCERVTNETHHAPQPGAAADIRIVLAVAPVRGADWARDWAGDASGPHGGGSGAAESRGSRARAGHAHESVGLECKAIPAVVERLTRAELAAALEGLEGAAQYGGLQGYPLHGVRATILSLHRPRGLGPDALRRACSEALPLAVEMAAPVLLEPMMDVELRAPEHHVGTILKELSGNRRADIKELSTPTGGADTRHLVTAEVPLATLVGYADTVRSMTQGEAALAMEFARYRVVDARVFEDAHGY